MIKCWHYRRVIANCVDANTALPGPAQAHLQQCAACREFYEAETSVARQLSAGSEALQRAPSPFLHARIMASVAESRTSESRPMPGRGWMIGLATACVVLTAILWLAHRAPDDAGPVAANSAPGAPELVFGGQLPDAVRLRELTTSLDEPLENEVKLVVSDARTAMNSLAAIYLPGELRSSLFESRAN